jgi:hypothetical protein
MPPAKAIERLRFEAARAAIELAKVPWSSSPVGQALTAPNGCDALLSSSAGSLPFQ